MSSSPAKWKRGLLIAVCIILGVPLVLFLGLLATIAIMYGPTYAYRVLVYNEATIQDHQRVFPSKAVSNQPPVFNFAEAEHPLQIGELTFTYPTGKTRTIDFESYLEQSNSTAFIVIKDDAVLYEKYMNDHSRDSVQRSFSMAKSITSTLVGLAVQDGYIHSLDDKMVGYLPELKGRGLDEMTIKDLLVMNSGIAFNLLPKDAVRLSQPVSAEALMYSLPDTRSHILKLHAGREPVGAYFLYDDYHPLLEALIIERTSHKTISAYTEEKLWRQLGMEYPASWSLDSEQCGFEQAASGFNARAIDFAKFGRLFLKDGMWEGRQILPIGWVKEATSPDPNDKRPWMNDPDWKNAGGYYKYHWWGIVNHDGSYDYTATGSPGGQIIYISPSHNAIVVHNGASGDPMVWAMIARSIIQGLR